MKIFSAFQDNDYFSDNTVCSDNAEDLDNSYDLLLLWGGEDISPSIYGQKPVYTHAPIEPSKRDVQERIMLDKAVELDIPILGICRGSQMVCAHFGGSLWQDVTGHTLGTHTHSIYTMTGDTIKVTSTHHQMMIPSEGMVLVGWSKGLATEKRTAGTAFDFWPDREAEIVYVPWANALAVQGHPEYLHKSHEFPRYVSTLLKEYLHV